MDQNKDGCLEPLRRAPTQSFGSAVDPGVLAPLLCIRGFCSFCSGAVMHKFAHVTDDYNKPHDIAVQFHGLCISRGFLEDPFILILCLFSSFRGIVYAFKTHAAPYDAHTYRFSQSECQNDFLSHWSACLFTVLHNFSVLCLDFCFTDGSYKNRLREYLNGGFSLFVGGLKRSLL